MPAYTGDEQLRRRSSSSARPLDPTCRLQGHRPFAELDALNQDTRQMRQKNRQSPKLARTMLALFLPSPVVTRTIDHLEEQYLDEIQPRIGTMGAQMWYWKQALRNIVGARVTMILGRILDRWVKSLRDS